MGPTCCSHHEAHTSASTTLASESMMSNACDTLRRRSCKSRASYCSTALLLGRHTLSICTRYNAWMHDTAVSGPMPGPSPYTLASCIWARISCRRHGTDVAARRKWEPCGGETLFYCEGNSNTYPIVLPYS